MLVNCVVQSGRFQGAANIGKENGQFEEKLQGVREDKGQSIVELKQLLDRVNIDYGGESFCSANGSFIDIICRVLDAANGKNYVPLYPNQFLEGIKPLL